MLFAATTSHDKRIIVSQKPEQIIVPGLLNLLDNENNNLSAYL
jgi:hypothetical protein